MYKLLLLMLVSISIFAVPSIKEIENSFDRIANKYDIPASILKAIAFQKSGWNTNSATNSQENKGQFGIMGLTLDTINQGTMVLDIDDEDAIIDYETNIEITAALIAEIKDEFFQNGFVSESISDYAPILVEYAKYDLKDEKLARYFAREVYEKLSKGYVIENRIDNELKVQAGDDGGELVDFSDVSLFYKKYTEINSLNDIPFDSSPNQSNRKSGITIDQVIIHIMQGTFEGSISWFNNPSADVSAHYLVSLKGEIIQMVKLNKKAWHAGAHNSRSVGIEHEGFYNSPVHSDVPPTEAEYQASAKLTKFLLAKYNIPAIHRDAYHDANGNYVPWHVQRPALKKKPGILGHWDTNGKAMCPGHDWNWNYYMQLVTGENPNPQCTDACTRDEYKCESNSLKRCYDTNNDGCVEWGLVRNCGNNTCNANTASCDASGECSNECDYHGQKKCSGENVLSCVRNNNGCFVYVQDKKCTGGRVCEAGQCVEPDGRCRLGTGTYCKDDKLQHCEDGVYTLIDNCEFGCKEMPNGTPDRCKKPSECTPECDVEGESSCDGNKIITCTNNKGCLQKKTESVCGAGYVCSNGECIEDGNGNQVHCQENSFTTDTNYSILMLMLLFLSSLLILRKRNN